jgi:response regulator of citrate/malate metabolism
VHALDYLLKPVNVARLANAIVRYASEIRERMAGLYNSSEGPLAAQ